MLHQCYCIHFFAVSIPSIGIPLVSSYCTRGILHWFLCLIIPSIGIPLLLSLIHTASMPCSIGSFVVMILSFDTPLLLLLIHTPLMVFHWFLHAASIQWYSIRSFSVIIYLLFPPLLLHWFLHAAPIPIVFHGSFVVVIDSIGIPLLLIFHFGPL